MVEINHHCVAQLATEAIDSLCSPTFQPCKPVFVTSYTSFLQSPAAPQFS